MPAALSQQRIARLALLVSIFAILGSVKVWFGPGTGPFGVDGAFYVNVARNVQEGIGLKTSISMYHFGQLELPARSPQIYPVWPLLLGYTARLIGLYEAVDLLPKLFYFIDLLLLYVLTNRVAARLNSDKSLGEIITPGHLLVLLWGTNGIFFSATTYPYTDAPGLAVLFATLIAIDVMRSHLTPALVGLLAGIALLTRTQLVILGIAIVLALVWLAVCDRRAAPMAAAFLVTYAACAAFWYFVIYRVDLGPQVSVSTFRMWTEPVGWGQWLRDRVEGLVVSVSPLSPHSYFYSLRPAFVLPLIAAVVAIGRWWRARRFCFARESLLPAVMVIAGLGFFFSLNLYHHHPDFFIPWLFGFRHAIPVMILIVLAVPYLLRFGRAMRVIVLLVIAVTVLDGAYSIVQFVTTPIPRGPTVAEQQAVAWIDAHKPAPTVLTTRSQYLAVYSHANFHWTLCTTPRDTTRNMLEKLPIDFVVVFAPDRQCEFLRGLGDLLVERAAFGEGLGRVHVLGRKRPFTAPARAGTPPG